MSAVTDTPIPPLWVPLPELPRWLQDTHGLTEAEAWDVLVYLRTWPFYFRVVDEDENLMTWNGWDVKDWKIGRAHWKEDPPDIDYCLTVSWDAVASAVRQRQERKQQALPADQMDSPTIPKQANETIDFYHSGTQGRPTSISLIKVEMERRRKAGEVLTTLVAESEVLATWLLDNHPSAPSCTPKAIRNSLRKPLNEAVNEAKARK